MLIVPFRRGRNLLGRHSVAHRHPQEAILLETIKLNREFKRAYHRGKFKAHPLLVVYAFKTRQNSPRYGITVSKKVGNAPTRNRCRRIIYHALQSVLKDFSVGNYHIVLVARAATANAKSTDLIPFLQKSLKSLGVIT